jgi:hypothetical protein
LASPAARTAPSSTIDPIRFQRIFIAIAPELF